MEGYNDASAMAAPGTHQLSAGLDVKALQEETVRPQYVQALYSVCVCVCVSNNV